VAVTACNKAVEEPQMISGFEGAARTSTAVNLAACFMLDSCLAYSLTLKMGATCSITWRYISEGRILHNHRCENLKSYKLYVVAIA
jgi:hypothetical protein